MMSTSSQERMTAQFNLNAPPPQTLYQCHSAQAFRSEFESQMGYPVQHVADDLVTPEAERAIFLVGSVPLGMATNTSDIDFIVLVDSKKFLSTHESGFAVASDTYIAFASATDMLVAAEFFTLKNDIALNIHIVVTPTIKDVYRRLRRPNPMLNENEIKTLSRLRTGWLLWKSDGYLERHAIALSDPILDMYCCTKNLVSAAIYLDEALRVQDVADESLALHLGSLSAEMAYLAYFSSEGYSYLGHRWLAQIGHAIGAADRVSRHPLIKQSLHLLFPSLESTTGSITAYLHAVSEFLVTVRRLIELKPHFRDALSMCLQIPAPKN